MNTNQHRLPTTPEELDAHFATIFSREGREYGLGFKPHPTDIIVSTFSKCGTTWLQQIAHGLRTRGSMEFDEISTVTPWLELAFDLGIDLDAAHEAEPRVFKSHLSWWEVPKGARYIVSFRAPSDAFISLYRYFEGFMFEPDTIDLDTLFRWRNPPAEMGERGYWHHLASWWEQRNNPDVLLLCYEDMLEDLPGTVRLVAEFMHIPLDDELFERVVRQASRPFMLEHKNQFGEGPFRHMVFERTGIPVGDTAYKVTRSARDDPKYELSAEHHLTLEEIWQAQVADRFGLENYSDLRNAVRALNQTA